MYDKTKKLKELFDKWSSEELHSGKIFIRDGIVDEKEYENLPKEKKILFVLKEAYGGTSSWDLCKWLAENGPFNDNYSSTWDKCTQWAYGILNTDLDKICKFNKDLFANRRSEILKKISVINIKKSQGESESEDEDLKKYVEKDIDNIINEIRIINPDIIVCGSTFKFIKEKLNITEEHSDNWFYYSNFNEKNIIIIDYYHPANQYPNLLNYYGLINIYQQALIQKDKNKN